MAALAAGKGLTLVEVSRDNGGYDGDAVHVADAFLDRNCWRACATKFNFAISNLANRSNFRGIGSSLCCICNKE